MRKAKAPNQVLRNHREWHNWTQEQAAEALLSLCGPGRRGEINARMISRWERGEQVPSFEYREKLCRLYGVTSPQELGFLKPCEVEQEEQKTKHETDVKQIAQLLPQASSSAQVVEQQKWNTDINRSRDSILTLPDITLQTGNTIEALVADCAACFGLKTAEIVTLVQQWYGMTVFCHELQKQLDQEIKKLDTLKGMYPHQEFTFSRRSFLVTLAGLPTAWLASQKQKHKLVVELEELLPQCAASIIACWHLSGGNNLEAIEPILNSYLPTLILVTKHAPSYREVAAKLVAQIYSLKAILAWHLEDLFKAETYCIEVLDYSDIANDTNLRLTALNQHALIAYYAKNFEQALAKSEEADTILHTTTKEHIFPIVQGRVYMYLSALQAQQNMKEAEHTLEHAHKAFALQTTSAEPVPLYADCGHASLSLWDGLTYYHLGQHNATLTQQALTSLQTFGSLHLNTSIPERFRLECLNNRTLAAIQLNELEEATTCFEAAKQGATELESKQRGMEVNYAYLKMLKQWPKEVLVQDLKLL